MNNIDMARRPTAGQGMVSPNVRRALVLAVMGALIAPLAHADDAKPAAACDPYKDYTCLDSYLGTGFWERLTKYYTLENGQAAAPADPKAPPSRRDDVSP